MVVTNLILLRASFFEVFGREYDVEYTDIFKSQKAEHGVYIHQCVFNDFASSPLFFSTNKRLYIVIESTVFHNSSSSIGGGAIYYNCGSAPIALLKICASRCYIENSGSGMFGYFISKDANMFVLNHSSVIYCGPSFQTYQYNSPLLLKDSAPTISHYNSSSNYATHINTLEFGFIKAMVLSFCSFANNRAQNSYGIQITASPSFTRIMEYVNIIGNIQNGGYLYSILYGSITTMIITNSVFMDNSDLLVGGNGCNYKLFDCWVNHINTISTTNYANFTFHVKVFYTSTHTLQISKTVFCDNGEIVVNQIACQTIPQAPTQCKEETSNGLVVSVFSVLEFFFNAFWIANTMF